MSCLSLEFFEQMLILAVVVIVVVAIVKILIALVLPQLGWIGSVVMQVLTIVMWGVVAIVLIIFCFDIIKCFMEYAPHLSLHAK
jgi:hypothetical protein